MFRSKNSTSVDKILVQKYAADFSIPIELAHIVARRYPEYNEAKAFLFPDVKHLHDPETMPDIKTATDGIIESLNKKEGILIYCHDDTDGYTSASILYKTLKDLCRTDDELVFVYPIHREKDGYIINAEVLKDYKKKGVKLVITADFGISSEQNFRIVKEEGLKLVVCDHHEIKSTDFSVPAVDPKRPDSKYPFRELAGAGVSFKLAQSLYQKKFNLKPDEFYSLKKDFFPLVMIGTISDRVILRGENRIFCSHGLQVYNHINESWIRYFRKGDQFNIAQITEEIIPIIASAALCDPNYGTGILISNDDTYVAETIAKLKKVTIERRRSVELLFRDAVAAAKIYPRVIVAIIPFIKQHYLGSVSARLKTSYKRTSAVIGIKNDRCFGELRSNDIDLYRMLHYFQRYFLDYGGHRKAAGFTMIQQNLDRFVDEVVKYVSNCDEVISNEDLTADGVPEVFLNKSDINILMPLAPFGEGNPAPMLTDGIDIYTIDNKFTIRERG